MTLIIMFFSSISSAINKIGRDRFHDNQVVVADNIDSVVVDTPALPQPAETVPKPEETTKAEEITDTEVNDEAVEDDEAAEEDEAEEEVIKPVKLLSLVPYIGSDMRDWDRIIIDNMGITHKNAYNGFLAYGPASSCLDFDNTYSIEGKYSMLSATVFVPESEKNFENETQFAIYGDDEVLYSFYGEKKMGIKPFTIEVPIDSVDDLRIVMESHYSCALCLDNAELLP